MEEFFKPLYDHNGAIYTTNLLKTFARLGIPKIQPYYSYGWGYNLCAEVALNNVRHNCTLNGLNL